MSNKKPCQSGDVQLPVKIKQMLKSSDCFMNCYRFTQPFCNSLTNRIKDCEPVSWSAKKRYRTIIDAHNKPADIYNQGPSVIGEIEINKNCNLDCIMCNTSLSKRKNINMSLDLFEKIIIDLKGLGQSSVPLHTIGEPLINPLLEEYFKILRFYNISTFLSTNGQVLDKKLDLLIRYSDVIDTLRFSIDGATKETYEKIRRPGKFDKLIENLDIFNDINKNKKFFKNVMIDSIVSEDVQSELAYHLQFYSKYTDMNNIGLHLIGGLSPDNSYFLHKSILKNHIVLNNPCKQLQQGLHILNDGRVTACCRDYNGDLIYGSIMEQSPEELINGPRIKQLREFHVLNKFPPDHMCSNCYQINPVVIDLWENFIRLLVRRNAHHWVVESMQKKIDTFFEQCKDKIPSEKEYISLL